MNIVSICFTSLGVKPSFRHWLDLHFFSSNARSKNNWLRGSYDSLFDSWNNPKYKRHWSERRYLVRPTPRSSFFMMFKSIFE